MARKFKDLRVKMSPDAQVLAHARARSMKAELPLAELRQARLYSQKQLAEELHVQQPAVAKMEKKADMYISTLRRFVEAMGGKLVISAHFPDGVVQMFRAGSIMEGPTAGTRPLGTVKVQTHAKVIHRTVSTTTWQMGVAGVMQPAA